MSCDHSRRALAEKKFIFWTMHAFSKHKPKERDNVVSGTIEVGGK
jgi:hypothetical protein